MKNLTNSTYANLYLHAAHQLGLQYEVISKKSAIAFIFNTDKKILLGSHRLWLNGSKSVKRAVDKAKTSSLLQADQVPVPIFMAFTDRKHALQYALKQLHNNTHIVIKPSSGSNAIGIKVNPTTPSQIKEAVLRAFKDAQEIIIEEYIVGHHYRITIMDDEIIAVTQRIPAYVVGNGIYTVSELIERKNSLRAKEQLPLIVLRQRDLDYLKTAHINLDHIFPTGKHVRLHNGCDFEVGGDRERIEIDTIPQRNQKMFIKAINTLGLRFGGIDYISPDITVDFTKIKTAINEINSSPHQDVHYFDSTPNDNYAAKRIIQKIFE